MTLTREWMNVPAVKLPGAALESLSVNALPVHTRSISRTDRSEVFQLTPIPKPVATKVQNLP